MSNYRQHALTEFKAAGWLNEDGAFKDDMQKLLCDGVLELLDLFATHGHSGSSAPYAVNLFNTLAKFEPVVPVTGEDWEWHECSDGVFQNKRCSHVFKDAARFDGQAYDIQGIVFWDWAGPLEGETERFKSYFTSRDSAVPITFPYTPKTEYRERTSE